MEVFNSLAIPIKYITSEDVLKVPFGIYRRNKPKRIFVDNKNYMKISSVTLEIYFSNLKEQIEFEKDFESRLEDNNFCFSSSDDVVLDDGKTILKYYEIEVLEI